MQRLRSDDLRLSVPALRRLCFASGVLRAGTPTPDVDEFLELVDGASRFMLRTLRVSPLPERGALREPAETRVLVELVAEKEGNRPYRPCRPYEGARCVYCATPVGPEDKVDDVGAYHLHCEIEHLEKVENS